VQEEVQLDNGLPHIPSTKRVLEALKAAGFNVRFLHGIAKLKFGAVNINAYSVHSSVMSVCMNLSLVRCLICRSEA
jgi:hypothetical protein